MENNVFDYIKQEEKNWRIVRVPLTTSKDWNMSEHIERCTNVSNGWFHQGKNDGLRPYNDIVTPIINVAFRSEGFDVKDIVPFVNDISQSYKSFIVKKRHPQWARKNELDTFIDDVVESSVIYDLVLVKNINDIRPEVVDLKTLAFCDQTDVMAGSICIKHNYTIADLIANKGKWDSDKIDQAILLSKQEKSSGTSDEHVKTPSKYIEVYELRGHLPATWIDTTAEMNVYTPQMHIVCFYKDKDGNKQGITLYQGKDKPLSDNFKALKIDRIRSKGRACGRSIVETLFEPQVWANYSEIKIKQLLDSAYNLILTDSDELANQKLSELKTNTILKQQKGDNTQRLNADIGNITAFNNYTTQKENSARILGSASDAQLGTNPVSGTPFALQNLVVQQGQGMHEYRQGKIAIFFADVLYRDWILKYLVDDLNSGIKFSEELTLDEMQEIGYLIAEKKADDKLKEMILEGKLPKQGQREQLIQFYQDDFAKGGSRKFFETVKGEFESVPVSVMVNVAGKQRYMAKNADAITNIIREVLQNGQAIAQTPGIGKAFNQLLEESGMNPIDFTQVTKQPLQTSEQPAPQVGEAELATV
jgi:hypothetical protein